MPSFVLVFFIFSTLFMYTPIGNTNNKEVNLNSPVKQECFTPNMQSSASYISEFSNTAQDYIFCFHNFSTTVNAASNVNTNKDNTINDNDSSTNESSDIINNDNLSTDASSGIINNGNLPTDESNGIINNGNLSTDESNDASNDASNDNTNTTNDTSSNNNSPPNYDENSSIDYIQELRNLGYFWQTTGDDNLDTRYAILRFQSEHNLIVDGDFGPRSLECLRNRLNSQSLSYKDVINESPTTGKWITVNTTNRIITLYENNTVINKFPIAVANPVSLTPEGKYRVVCMLEDPYWGGGGYASPIAGGDPNNPLGHRWLGLSITPSGTSYGIHGNSSPYSIGTNASHGCIRMINQDSIDLYYMTPINSPVWIGSDNSLRNWGVQQNTF